MEKSDNGLCLQQLSIFVPKSDAVINVLDGSEHIKLDLDRWNDRLVVDIFESLSNKVHINPPVHIIVHHDNPNAMIVSEMREEELLSRLLSLADPSSSGKSCKSGEIVRFPGHIFTVFTFIKIFKRNKKSSRATNKEKFY